MGKERQTIAKNEKIRLESKVQEKKTEVKQEVKSEVKPVETPSEKKKEPEEKKRWGTGEAYITQVKCLDHHGIETNVFKTGDSIKLQIFYKVKEKVKEANFGIGVFRTDGIHCFGTNTQIDKLKKFDLLQDGCTELLLHSFDLLPGEYTLDFAIGAEGCADIDYCKELFKIQIHSDITDIGVVRLSHSWKI